MDPRLCEKRGFKVGETTTALLPSGKLLLSVDTVFVDDDVAVFCLGYLSLVSWPEVLLESYLMNTFSFPFRIALCPFHTFHSRPKIEQDIYT